MKTLPEEVILSAFVSKDGEYAWQLPQIFAALRSIAEIGQAILGGDVWTVVNGEIHSLFPNTKGIRMWNTKPQNPDELWFDYCQRTCIESIGEIENTELENAVSQEFQQYIFYSPTYIEENDIRSFIPRDKYDVERAEMAIKLGYPAVTPILPELLEWIQDMNWLVAQPLAPFLASIGSPLIPHIHQIFRTDDEVWKYWIISRIFSESRELATAFRAEIERIAYSPTKQEEEEELQETALDLLKEYGWEKNTS